jgi:hypothetical protein
MQLSINRHSDSTAGHLVRGVPRPGIWPAAALDHGHGLAQAAVHVDTGQAKLAGNDASRLQAAPKG